MPSERRCQACSHPMVGEEESAYCTSCLLGDVVSQISAAGPGGGGGAASTPAEGSPTALSAETLDAGSSTGGDGLTTPTYPALRLEPGTKFGDYEIEALIARGGMGAVYRARQVSLDRPVALKMVLTGSLGSDELLQRFRVEAETVGRLDHPNIVSVYEVGNHLDLPFFSMRLIDGGSLAEHMDDWALPRPGGPGAGSRSPFSLRLDNPVSPDPASTSHRGGSRARKVRLVRFVSAVARALHYAHERGVLHRDIKPANILVDAQGEPQITDFGLAKQIGSEDGLTLTGALLGTPHYMAPEQATGDGGGETTASDLFSLGGVFYHLLTGSVPFPGSSTAAVIQKVIHEEPERPSRRNPAVDLDLETICLACLEKDPGRRYPSAGALADDLDRWLRNEPIDARPAGALERFGKWCRRHPAVAATLALASTSAVGFVLVLASSEAKLQVERDIAVERRTEAERANAELAGVLQRVQLDRAGELMRTGNASHSLAILARAVRDDPADPAAATQLLQSLTGQPLGRLVGAPILHRGPVRVARFDPAGARLATASEDGTARVWDASTGGPVTPPLEHGSTVRVAAFGPAGDRLATGTEAGVARVWDARTGAPLTDPLMHGGSVVNLAYDPGGRWVATGSTDKALRLWDAATGQLALGPFAFSNTVDWVGFDPGGDRVAGGGASGAVHVWETATGAALGKYPAGGEVWSAHFDPSGERLLVSSLSQRALVYDLAGDNPSHLHRVNHLGYVVSVRFSPWGDRFATASWDQTARVWDAATGKPLTPPLRHDARVRRVRFSPDGFRLVTASSDYTARVWDADTGAAVTLPLRHGGAVNWAEFSPDGRWVATASDDGRARVWDVRVAPQLNPKMKHNLPVNYAEFNPAGDLLATASQDRTARLWEPLTGRPASPPIRVRYEAKVARFSPGGERLLVAARNNAAFILDGRTGETLEKLPHNWSLYDGCWDPDGKRIVTACRDGRGYIWDVGRAEEISGGLRHGDAVIVVAFAPAGDSVATGSRDGTARVWSAADGAPLTPPLPHGSSVHHVAFSPSGERLVTASDLNSAIVWDTRTGRSALPPLRHGRQVLHAVFSPDGSRLLTASSDGTARLWDAARGNPVGLPMRHLAGVQHAAFDAGGGRVVTASNDGTARVWDGWTGRPLCTPLEVGHPILMAGFDRAGHRVVTAGMGGAQVFVIPPVDRGGAVPPWLPELAESVAGTRLVGRGLLVATPAENDAEMRLAGELDGGADGLYSRWGRWFLAGFSERPRSPFGAGSGSLDQFLARCLEEGTTKAIKTAVFAAPDDPSVVAAAALSRLWQSPGPGADPVTERLRQRALNLVEKEGEAGEDGGSPSPSLRPFRGLRFDGTDDRVVVPHIPFDQLAARGGVTVEVWVWKWRGSVLTQGWAGDPENSLFVAVGPEGTRAAYQSTGFESGRGTNHLVPVGCGPALAWRHLALVYRGGRMRIYSDGALLADREARPPGPFRRDRDLLIGANREVNGPIFGTGVIRLVRVSSVERYSGDAPFEPEWDPQPDAATVLHLDFSRAEGDVVPDLSGSSPPRDGRIEGAVPVSFGWGDRSPRQ